MKGLLLLILSSLLCWVSADIRCHSCYKLPVLGCMASQSCALDPGQKCLTTMCTLVIFLLYWRKRANLPAPRPTPALALVFFTSLAGLGLWLLH
ncbi:lymphocyte antigen 6 complex locus protein G6c [Erinaceus europaeus]|uniref:Lymphocyte antigen 6 complex locus protein G6c n=1 Tax=Erinaceus europaeus TaxID=9365 RepID=A0ABM3XD95_ERIEU|nr:lymphocyte antigen 6 complex locus protein G6c [Erinaceus europaeus]